MLFFQWLHFNDLNKEQLYALLRLRNDVFICEQQCPYQDLDERDINATHLLCFDNNILIAYLRILDFTDNTSMSIGRVLTASSHRKKGIGKQLMQQAIDYLTQNYPTQIIKISAQHYLVGFYQHFGFQAVGEIYDEDGIDHIQMVKQP